MKLNLDELGDYVQINEAMQKRQWGNRNYHWQKNADIKRFADINAMKRDAKTVLSVGCGPKEPVAIGATHACDIAMCAEIYLRQQSWKGEFRQCSCDKLPYTDKSMDFVVCSEVIEHLPCEDDIRATFIELDRVGKRWLVTTPWITHEEGNTEPTHRHFLNEDKIRKIMPEWEFLFVRIGIFLFVSKCDLSDCEGEDDYEEG